MTSQYKPSSYRLFRPALQHLFAALVATLLSGAATTVAHAATTQILVFGDSLSAGFGIGAQEALPAQLETRLRADGFDAHVINAGVSGDTTAMGLARLDYTLDAGKIDIAIIELGANDMLRGIDPKIARANLDRMIAAFQAKGVTVMLATMASSDNGARLVAAKGRELIERHRQFGTLDKGECIGRVAREGVVDIADEAQGDVIIFDIDPARVRNAAAQPRQILCDRGGNFQRREKSWHRFLPSSPGR